MDQELVRTCSAGQAAVLAREAGRCLRIGTACVRIHRPAAANRIDRSSSRRYVARVELLDATTTPDNPAGSEAAAVVAQLFGPYLAEPPCLPAGAESSGPS